MIVTATNFMHRLSQVDVKYALLSNIKAIEVLLVLVQDEEVNFNNCNGSLGATTIGLCSLSMDVVYMPMKTRVYYIASKPHSYCKFLTNILDSILVS